MSCRNLHDHLDVYFAGVDAHAYREAVRAAFRTEDWATLLGVDPERDKALSHARTCSDCLDDILSYLEIQDTVDYREFPCLHLAYYSTKEEVRCLDMEHHGCFILLCDKEADGIGIGFCPWCGLPFPSTHAEEMEAEAVGIRAWQKKELERLLHQGFQ